MEEKQFKKYCTEAIEKTLDEISDVDTDNQEGKTMSMLSAMIFCTMMKKHLTDVLKSEGELESDEPMEESTVEGVM